MPYLHVWFGSQMRPCSTASRDFAKWPDDAPQDSKKRCFVVYYGAEFNLKTLSCLTLYDADVTTWCQGESQFESGELGRHAEKNEIADE